MTEIKAKGIWQSVSFDGQTVHYRKGLSSASIPLSAVASVRCGGGRITVVDSGGTRYMVATWFGGGKVRDAIEAAKRGFLP